MADEKRINEEIQENVVIPEEMKLKEGELLRIRAHNYNPENGSWEIQFNTNGERRHIMEVLATLCDSYDMVCIPKNALSMGIMIGGPMIVPVICEDENYE